MLALLLTFTLQFGSVEASEQIKASLRVYPVKIEMPVKAGETCSADINVQNTGDRPAKILVYAQDFTKDEKGNYTFYKPGERAISMSAASWLSPSMRELELDPSESRVLDVELSAPKDAEPGGHYTMVFVEAEPKVAGQDIPQGAHILSKARVGVLVLGTVGGQIRRLGALGSFKVASFNFGPRVPSTVVFENKGNVHIELAGIITFKDWRGRQVGSIPIVERTSLPASKLEISEVWEGAPLIGRFTANAKIISKDGKEWVKSQSFWIFPLKEAAYILGLIVILAGAWYIVTRKFQFKVERRQ